MSGELKSENINTERSPPLEEAIIQPKIHNHPNTYNQLQSKILVPILDYFTILEKTIKDNTNKTLLNQ
jgi:hypothetical protein